MCRLWSLHFSCWWKTSQRGGLGDLQEQLYLCWNYQEQMFRDLLIPTPLPPPPDYRHSAYGGRSSQMGWFRFVPSRFSLLQLGCGLRKLDAVGRRDLTGTGEIQVEVLAELGQENNRRDSQDPSQGGGEKEVFPGLFMKRLYQLIFPSCRRRASYQDWVSTLQEISLYWRGKK